MKWTVEAYVFGATVLFNSVKILVLATMMVGFFGLFIYPFNDMELVIGFVVVDIILGLFCWIYLRNIRWYFWGLEVLSIEDEWLVIRQMIGSREVYKFRLKIEEIRGISYNEDIHYPWYYPSFPRRSIGRFKMTSIFNVDYYFGQNTDKFSEGYVFVQRLFSNAGIEIH